KCRLSFRSPGLMLDWGDSGMRKILVAVLIAVSLSVSIQSVQPVTAEPTCVPGDVCPHFWGIVSLMALNPTVPFAWLRSDHDSSAASVYTITSHGVFNLYPEKYYKAGDNDGWYQVSIFPPDLVKQTTIRGWIEEKSLQLLPKIAIPDASAAGTSAP